MKEQNNPFRAALLCVLSAAALTACGDKLPDPPDSYALEGDSVESLTAVVGEEVSGEMTKMETPETAAAASSSGSETPLSGDETCYYSYEKLETGGETVRQYAERLVEDGFQIVDAEGVVTDAPDYGMETGSVALARTASEDGKILRLDIAWSATDCEITLTRPEGAVSDPVVEPEGLTNNEAVNYFKTLTPAALGLPGESMADYFVYPQDGAVMVDGAMCLRLQVYQSHQEGETNQIAGIYLMTGDQQHIYRLEDGAVREVNR